MLDKVDLTKKLSKKQYKELKDPLEARLYELQMITWDAHIPIIIVFEGWDAAGKGNFIQTLIARLDPRGFKLHRIRPVRTYEKKRPWLWRFWYKIPARGEWAIFDRSWYGRVLVERMEHLVPENEWSRGYQDIVDFERALADDGYLMVKFFLHIDQKVQKKRLKRLQTDPFTMWRVRPEDWERNKHYNQWVQVYEEMFEHTDSEWGPWTIIEAHNGRYARIKIMRTLISALEERLSGLGLLPTPEVIHEAVVAEES